MCTSKSNETPVQKIKRLEKELAEQRLKNEVFNYMIDLSDKKYGIVIRKKFETYKSSSYEKIFLVKIIVKNFHITKK